MSIALMTLAWKSELPAGRKMVLLALCDNANDQGECFPSITMLAKKCSMGERTVQQHITDMEADGIVKREMRNGRSTIYYIDPRRICTPAESAPPQISHPTPAESAPITIKEPSRNHQVTINKGVDQSDDFKPLGYLLSKGVGEQVARDWLKHRKAKRAAASLTVIDDREKQAAIASISLEDALKTEQSRGWTGFNAEWIKPKPAALPIGRAPAQTGPIDRSAANEEAKRLAFGKKRPEVIDV